MTNLILEDIVKQKDYIFKSQLFKFAKEFKLNINELLLIVYFLNETNPSFDIPKIKNITYLEDREVMESFTTLSEKGIINVLIEKNEAGIINEVIDLTNLFKLMIVDLNSKAKKTLSENIFTTFEREFGRPLSPIEFEIINAWISSGVTEELIIGALKEATFNGVRNLRYIDKIIHEWNKKGFKKMEDVNNHIIDKKPAEAKVLFDYNWLDEE